ncbi:FecR domain-containing protein [Candidatus Pelagibacter sp. Uisw_099_02]|uniref:FecR family protein n=1 Tax=Candidatus Pelagibacter sp. Uisw_099_02 TaxID=3230981 RepID=UPI0039EB4B80
MKKIVSTIIALFFVFNITQAEEKIDIDKQLVGIVGAISGTAKAGTRELKAGDKIYLNETIYAGIDSGTQILLLDQSTFTIGSDSEVVMDTFIYDPTTNDGKIVANVKKGSLKIISGLISKKNPDSLTVNVPEGTLGSRGTEFQTIVSNQKTDTLLIGPGKNNTLGLRPGAVLVGNNLGQTLLSNPYSVASMVKGSAPGKAKQITKNQLKKFKKRMKVARLTKLDGATKEERKATRKKIRQELKAQGFDKEEIKILIKENIKKDEEKRIVLLTTNEEEVSDIAQPENIVEEKVIETEDKIVVEKKDKSKNKKEVNKKDKKKNKKEVNKKNKKKNKKAVKKKDKKKNKKAVKKKDKKKNKKAVKKKGKTKKKKAVKKSKTKKKKVVKKKVKKKKVIKKKAKKITKKKIAKKKQKAKNKRKRKK